jgi:mitochondrial fission protein ELM1
MFTIASLEVSSGQQAVAQHEHSPASSIPEGANSVRVTFSRRSPQCRPLDLRNQVQSREKQAWNSSRRSKRAWISIYLSAPLTGRGRTGLDFQF